MAMMTESKANKSNVANLIKDRYLLCEEISRGSFGLVYKGIKIDDNSQVVIKVIARTCARSIEKIEHDRLIPAMFDHPGIVKIADYIQTAMYAFIVYPYIPGSIPLSARKVGNYNMSVPAIREQLACIAIDLCRIVKLMHTNRVIHGDIKPQNIILANDTIFMIDFDLAGVIGNPDLQVSTRISGTPNYLAPEIWLQHDDINYKLADIYSLGVTLYYIFNSKKLPYRSNCIEDLEYQVKNAKPIPSNSGIKALDDLIMRTISAKPMLRPSIRKLKCGIKKILIPS